MRRITWWLVGTVSGVVLLFSYRTSTMGPTAVAAGDPSSTPAPTSAPTAGAAVPATGSSGGSAPADGSGSSTTFTGASTDTRWGPVQVRITVAGGRITKAEAVVYPQDNPRDLEINSAALPVLAQEVLTAQSAHIDTVSGATVTSDGYITSLQSAIDAAHLGS